MTANHKARTGGTDVPGSLQGRLQSLKVGVANPPCSALNTACAEYHSCHASVQRSVLKCPEDLG
jgi:hypothetical protein